MEYKFTPRGVCSNQMVIETEQDTITNVKIIGGCAGNTVGITQLIKGMKIKEAIKRLKGIPCGLKGTSCPDQLAQALENIIKEEENEKI